MTLDELQAAIARLAETQERVRALATRATDPRRRPAEKEFSVVENVCHLRDIEADGYVVRIRRLLDESEPLLDDLDGARLAVERRYNDQDLATAIDAFATARANSVAMLRAIEDATALERRGTYPGEGPVTLAEIVARMCEHDEGHVRDIEALG